MKHRIFLKEHLPEDDYYPGTWRVYRTPSVRVWDGECQGEFANRASRLLRGFFPLDWKDAPWASEEDSLDSYIERLNQFLLARHSVFFKEFKQRRDAGRFRTFKLVHNDYSNCGASAAANLPRKDSLWATTRKSGTTTTTTTR